MRRPGAAAVLLLALWVCLPATTLPVAAAATVPAIVVDPAYGPPLTTLRVTGRGFCPAPCSPVAISAGALFVEGGVSVDAAGRFTTFIRLPGTVRPGELTLSATQTTRSGSPVEASTTFTVTISVPAPTTYPPPATIQAPGGLPPAATPTVAAPPTPSPTHTAAATATTKAAATSAPAPTASASTSSVPSASATVSAVQAAPTAAPTSGTSPGWWLLLAAAAAAAAGGLVVWLRRHPHA